MAVAEVDTELGLEEISLEELRYIRKLREKAQARQQTPYRKNLLARIEARRLRRPIPDLIDGGYHQYRVTAGQHMRYDLVDIVEQQKKYQDRLKNAKPGEMIPPPETPTEHTFLTGDLVVPETDTEALMMDQDPRKFSLFGTDIITPNTNQQQVDELLAETNRLKALLAQNNIDAATGQATDPVPQSKSPSKGK